MENHQIIENYIFSCRPCEQKQRHRYCFFLFSPQVWLKQISKSLKHVEVKFHKSKPDPEPTKISGVLLMQLTHLDKTNTFLCNFWKSHICNVRCWYTSFTAVNRKGSSSWWRWWCVCAWAVISCLLGFFWTYLLRRLKNASCWSRLCLWPTLLW